MALSFVFRYFILFSIITYSVSAQSTSDSTSVNVANVPDCAKACLSNSTQYATDCAQIDVKCLCSSPSYVSALSCCLATNCNAADQQTAIQFNIQECAAVNSTAPNFVGCSPFSLTTGRASTQTASTSSGLITGASTISGGIVSVPATYTNSRISTANFGGSPILTGSCSVPLFAQITGTAGNIVEFPQVGCALNRGACCPFNPGEYAGLTKCPSDYQTTAGACCPSGYSVYYAALGAETPCFSHLTQTLLPASTPSKSAQFTLITDAVFTQRYTLVQGSGSKFSTGSIVGITMGSIALVIIIAILIWRTRRHKAERLAAQHKSTTFPPEEPALHGPTASHAQSPQMSEAPTDTMITSPKSPQELASPESAGATSKSAGLRFPPPDPLSSPPSYVKSTTPQEMPGSTYMHEHHPAFTPYGSGSGAASGAVDGTTLASGSRNASIQQSPPRTPPRSPATMSTRSPVLSPSSPSPYRTDSPITGLISPLGSPGLPPQTASPRFKEGTM